MSFDPNMQVFNQPKNKTRSREPGMKTSGSFVTNKLKKVYGLNNTQPQITPELYEGSNNLSEMGKLIHNRPGQSYYSNQTTKN